MDYKESWVPKNWCFWTVVLEKTLEISLDTRRSNQSIIKEMSPWCSLEGLVLNLKLKTLATWYEQLAHWKDPDAGKDWKQEKGMTEDEMVGCHHWLNGHEFEQAPGDGEGQGSLACCMQFMGSQRVRHNRVTDQQLKFLENEHEKRYQQPGEGEVTAE